LIFNICAVLGRASPIRDQDTPAIASGRPWCTAWQASYCLSANVLFLHLLLLRLLVLLLLYNAVKSFLECSSMILASCSLLLSHLSEFHFLHNEFSLFHIFMKLLSPRPQTLKTHTPGADA
jgi:hypothetical protein